jgi:hypothetical protein
MVSFSPFFISLWKKPELSHEEGENRASAGKMIVRVTQTASVMGNV